MSQGVTCSRCGGSTPLPADLRVPSFRCSACGGELATAHYLNQDIASAEHFSRSICTKSARIVSPRDRPRASSRRTLRDTRAANCRHCNGAIQVPLALREKTVTCPTCHRDGGRDGLHLRPPRALRARDAAPVGGQRRALRSSARKACRVIAAERTNPVNDPTSGASRLRVLRRGDSAFGSRSPATPPLARGWKTRFLAELLQ